MKFKFFDFLIIIFFLGLVIYAIPKSPDFPNPPLGFTQSFEPADVETPLRRGYYTNLSRDEVINYYKQEFNKGFSIYTPRFNYPPEEAQTIIRDQTKSTFLEEIVHPLRESLYINGFEPKSEEYAININGVRWNQKVIVRYVPSNLYVRLIILGLTLAGTLLLVREYRYAKK